MRNSTCSKCPLNQNREYSLGCSWLHRKAVCSAITWEMDLVSVPEGCTPAQCSAVPAYQQLISHGPSGHTALAHPTCGILWNYPSPTCESIKTQLYGGDQIKINLAWNYISIAIPAQGVSQCSPGKCWCHVWVVFSHWGYPGYRTLLGLPGKPGSNSQWHMRLCWGHLPLAGCHIWVNKCKGQEAALPWVSQCQALLVWLWAGQPQKSHIPTGRLINAGFINELHRFPQMPRRPKVPHCVTG